MSAWNGLLPPFAFEHSKRSGMGAKATNPFCGSMNLSSFFLSESSNQMLIK